MVAPVVLWTEVAGVVFLGAGLSRIRKQLGSAQGIEKLIVLGCVFFAVPLAVFGAEHLTAAKGIAELVPAWMPVRIFWAYFVGVALLAGALSLTLRRYMQLSSTLLAIMFLLFVLLIHIPNVVAHMRERIFWTLVLRELSFTAGALALAGSLGHRWLGLRPAQLVTVARFLMGIAVIVFGIQHFLYPKFAPGVPLSKLTPAWVPLPLVWAWIAGLILFAAGIFLLVNRYARHAAGAVGLLMVVLTLVFYTPELVMASGTLQMVTGVNYVADTLLYGGAALLLAGALRPADAVAPLLR